MVEALTLALLLISAAGAVAQPFTFGDQAFLNAARPASAPLTIPTYVRSATNISTTAASLTLPAFSVTGSNPYLIVTVAERSTVATRTISSVTANLVSMTLLYSTNFVDTKGRAAIYGLAGASTGDIVVTLSGNINQTFYVAALLYNGSTTTGTAAADYSVTARTSVSVAPTTVATDVVVDLLASNVTWTQGGSQVLRANEPGASSDSTLPGAAGTTTMSWSGTSTPVSLIAIPLNGM